MSEDSRSQIQDRVVQTICGVSGRSSDEVTGHSELILDLNLDSLAIFEIVIELEEAFDMRIADEDVDKIKTVNDVVDYILARDTTGKQD